MSILILDCSLYYISITLLNKKGNVICYNNNKNINTENYVIYIINILNKYHNYLFNIQIIILIINNFCQAFTKISISIANTLKFIFGSYLFFFYKLDIFYYLYKKKKLIFIINKKYIFKYLNDREYNINKNKIYLLNIFKKEYLLVGECISSNIKVYINIFDIIKYSLNKLKYIKNLKNYYLSTFII